MFLPVNILNFDCKFVIDTGSAVTIISSDMFHKLTLHSDIQFKDTSSSLKLEVADRGQLNVDGIATINQAKREATAKSIFAQRTRNN